MTTLLACVVVVGTLAARGQVAAPPAKMVIKQEHFDADPAWDGLNNRLKLEAKDLPVVDEDFGYSPTQFAGGAKGEIGGKIWRSVTPAHYADKIPPKTLNDKLTASGRFTFTDMASNGGLWFGWFNADRQQVGNARPTSALGLNLDFQGDGARLSVRMQNDKREGCGTFITPYLPGEFRTTPLVRNIQYAWTISYDPQANGGNGRVECMLKSLTSNPEYEARKTELAKDWDSIKSPRSRSRFATGHYGAVDFDGKIMTFDLPPGFKQTGATFDHFGLLGIMKEGSPATVYFDDLAYDGKSEDFAKDPGWEGLNNRAQIAEPMRTGYHDFGFSPDTHFAGGTTPGEMGGIFWRLSKAYGYYADRVGPLTLDDPLEAHGRLMLKFGTPDCEMCFGWLNSSQKERIPIRTRTNELGAVRRDPRDTHLGKSDHFLGVYLTNDHGAALRPALVTAKGTKAAQEHGTPRPAPGQSYEWSLKYDPTAEGGRGALSVTLDGQTATLVLDPKLREEGATFDRFGFFPSGGGGMVQIYFDDLQYTARR
jgi:hypothetical protein